MLAPEGGGRGGDGSASLIEAARRVAAEVLAPAAEATDQADVVPRSHLEALAAAGLFDLLDQPAMAAAEVYEALAGACGVSFFVWAQHHSPVRLLAASPNAELRERWLPALRSGEVLAGIAFAHLRRPGPPAIVAESAGGGYVLRGEAPWVTSWGLAGVFAVAARCGDRVVWSLVPADNRPAALRPSPPLRLAVMNASSTVRLAFDDLVVPEADVIAEVPFADWQAADRVHTASPNPAAFGVAAACTRLLVKREPATAQALEDERLECKARARAADPEDLDGRIALRAWSLELAVRSAFALVAATGGRSMTLDRPAQRLYREASFYAIQAQTPALRRATLARVTRR